MARNVFIAIFSVLLKAGFQTSYVQPLANTGDTYLIKAIDNGD